MWAKVKSVGASSFHGRDVVIGPFKAAGKPISKQPRLPEFPV